jgi:hypothetical protein
MAFDQVRNRIVLFGGRTSDNGTWEWDGQFWTQMSDMGPSPRRDASMAWDNASKRVLLFGGVKEPDDTLVRLGDTWEWDGVNWTQLDDAGPAARLAHAVASDTTRNRIVLFGGDVADAGAASLSGETWEWDGAAWTQLEETGPSPRTSHGMAFDSVRRRTVLFGGKTIDGNSHGDTWEWTGSAWINVSQIGPASRLAAVMSFDGTQSILFGGNPSQVAVDGAPLGDTWSWDGTFWTQRQDIGPKPRSFAAMAFDSTRNKTVMFGGTSPNGGDFSDTWELSERA